MKNMCNKANSSFSSQSLVYRRLLIWLIFLALQGFNGIFILIAMVIMLYSGESVSRSGVAIALILIAVGLLGTLAAWALPRRLACLRNVKPDEFGVLVDWLLKGDPFGRKAGRHHCHLCGHNRGSLAVCPECGAERIDPI